MTDGTSNTQTSDESVRGERGAQVTSIKLVGFDRPFFTATALVAGLVGILLSGIAIAMTLNQLSANEYWLSRSEAFLEQLATQGVKIPDDLLRHKGSK